MAQSKWHGKSIWNPTWPKWIMLGCGIVKINFGGLHQDSKAFIRLFLFLTFLKGEVGDKFWWMFHHKIAALPIMKFFNGVFFLSCQIHQLVVVTAQVKFSFINAGWASLFGPPPKQLIQTLDNPTISTYIDILIFPFNFSYVGCMTKVLSTCKIGNKWGTHCERALEPLRTWWEQFGKSCEILGNKTIQKIPSYPPLSKREKWNPKPLVCTLASPYWLHTIFLS